MLSCKRASLANDTHSVMVREISEQPLLRPQHPLILLVMVGALALTLAACGRRGALDPPPGGYAFEPGTVRTPTTRRGLTREQETTKQPEYDDEGRLIAPEGRKKKLPGDWLID